MSLDLEPINELHRKIQEKLSSMISAKDLRIGNKIQVYNDICDVTGIEDDGTIGTTAYFDGRMGCCGCTENMAVGIPLTLEILEKCGFHIMDESMVQRCLICGIIISDYRNTMSRAGTPPAGYAAGEVFFSEGNPRISGISLIAGTEYENCKP